MTVVPPANLMRYQVEITVFSRYAVTIDATDASEAAAIGEIAWNQYPEDCHQIYSKLLGTTVRVAKP